jgi:flagellar hook-associated protein 2
MVQFKDAIVFNMDSELGYTPETKVTKVEPVEDFSLVFLQTENDEIPLGKVDSTGLETSFQINISDYEDKIENIIVKNNNTGKTAYISFPSAINPNAEKGFEPSNPISVAQDAKLKYEGITMYRPTNKIDDIVENVTLNLEAPTEKTATIKIEPDTETSKEAIIELVGYYNQLIAEINILTQNKPELISELDYLSEDEIESYEEKLGMFSGDSTLTSSKSSLQRIMTNTYPIEGSTIRLLSQIGISSNATGSTGYDATKLRGYFEIDESKLDEVLKNNISDIKNLFGYDSDGDMIIDTGIAYLMEKNLQAYVQTGGILASKTRTLDTKISNSEKTISRLETQLETKEQEYRTKFGNMESTLSNLESQSDSITNFNNQQSKNNN